VQRNKFQRNKSQQKNKKFTLIGLTALTGDPVMCILIIEGKTPNGSVESGIDFTVMPSGEPSDEDYIIRNSGPGKHFPGGPVCTFRNKKVPALIRWTESASITSQVLVEALQVMDELELFPRTDTVKPFLLLDGHGSRLEMPFLHYINNPKDHWVVCFGVPYGTALWQVGDSKEQNGSFNIAINSAKDEVLERKEELGITDGVTDTDMMPIINIAWKNSFARVGKNRQAITNRGWNPLNRALLLDDELRSTMTKKQKSKEFLLENNIIFPSKNTNAKNGADPPSDSAMTTIQNNSATASINDNNNVATAAGLNFNSSLSSFCLKSIISQEQIHETRERINEDMNTGKELKEILKESKRITSGIIFKAGSVRLGKTVFDIHMENMEDKRKEAITKIKKDEKEYYDNVAKAKEVFDKKTDLQSMTIRELTIICKPLKRKEDGKMPTKKVELIQKYNEWNGRPIPSFNVSEYETDKNANNDNTGIIIGTDNENNFVDI